MEAELIKEKYLQLYNDITNIKKELIILNDMFIDIKNTSIDTLIVNDNILNANDFNILNNYTNDVIDSIDVLLPIIELKMQ